MENDFFLNAGIPLPIPAWVEPSFNSDHTQDCFFNPNFDSAFGSMVSSPATTNSNASAISELIGKLGNIPSTVEISQQPMLAAASSASCYSTPLSSPTPNPNLPAELPRASPSPPLCSSVDPGFAERAARFSYFGSRSFNGRASHFEPNNSEIPYTNPLSRNGRLPRVSSSPSLKAVGLPRTPSFKNRPETVISQDESTVSEANPNGDSNSRKRKAAPKGKARDTKLSEANDDPDSKKCKKNENGQAKTEEESKGDEKQSNSTKPPEPHKDYIHVRARRGQATDSHSLAERVRREKISERMKLLQDLVPGCNKITGKALMLDEIINYVQSLQRQVEFLSMKLASVNSTRLDINMDTLMPKDIFQHNSSLSRPIFPVASTLFDHHQNPSLSDGTITQCSSGSVVDPLLHLPPIHQFTATVPRVQCPAAYYEGDLQSIVHMGIGQNSNPEPEQDFQGSNQAPHMKVEH